ncbi:hypothetical protein OF83DRAFT_502390 [Amylostereum chailletii]|nr:hypothetical protein OF83DRAFT_502390 [Amylostereum chailletii]
MTITRDTTVPDPAEWADGSQLDIDYDDITVAPAYVMDTPLVSSRVTPPPMSPRHPLSPSRHRPPQPQQQPPSRSQQARRTTSPTRSLNLLGMASPGRERVNSQHALGRGKANSVAGGLEGHAHTHSHSSPRKDARGNKGAPPGQLVQRKILEDGPERTISIWREGVAKSSSELGEEEAKTEADSHAGRRRVSASTQAAEGKRRDEQGQATGSRGTNGKVRALRRSIDLTQPNRTSLQRSLSNASSPPRAPGAQASPRKSAARTEQTTSSSDRSGNPPIAPSIERVLSSCQPSLMHIAPVLEELGVRRDEHLSALARMREETRDREVKEEALKMGVTVVEWAILIDRLQGL